MTHETLLLELLTEELPPKTLKIISESFAAEIFKKLKNDALTSEDSKLNVFATPRRIGLQITDIKDKGEVSNKELKILPKEISFDEEGKPTELLRKKIIGIISNPKNRISIDFNIKENDFDKKNIDSFILKKIEFKTTGKQEYLFLNVNIDGIGLTTSVQMAITESIKKLPIAKVMSYQKLNIEKKIEDIRFVRPAHSLLALHGDKTIHINAIGLESNRITGGHRFIGERNIEISHAEEYEEQLERIGKVIPNFEKRKNKVKAEIEKKFQLDHLYLTEELLNEITSLCEFPAVYEGSFDNLFLNIPPECLILTMQKHQRYIPVKTSTGKLSNKFLIVSNIKTDRPEAIINGNERVLKARLSDAQFFFTLDRQNRLENNLDTLKKVIYHNRLGNIFERTQRLVFLTKKFGIILGLDEKLCERSALLSKADLVSKMVGEFPELQGVMGKYYSQFDCENSEVSISIEEHYLPRFSGDQIPNTMLGNCLSLADKIESIVGLWSVGVTPTGEKDPMGLRRNAIGIIRIIMENKVNINLDDIINYASQSLKYNLTLDDNFSKLKSFFLERLSNLLKERKFPIANIDAVLMNFDGKLFEISNKLDAISHFLSIPESRGLCATNKRINNILRKATKNIDPEMLDPNLFQEKSEFILFNQLTVVATSTSKLISDKKFKETLFELCKLKSPVDNFFNDVLVNTTNEKLRINRLCLLMTLNKTMNEVAELSLLVE